MTWAFLILKPIVKKLVGWPVFIMLLAILLPTGVWSYISDSCWKVPYMYGTKYAYRARQFYSDCRYTWIHYVHTIGTHVYSIVVCTNMCWSTWTFVHILHVFPCVHGFNNQKTQKHTRFVVHVCFMDITRMRHMRNV